MKLSEFLSDIGRPVAYYPGLRKVTRSTTATIFLCQFIYWTGKEAAGDGWIYKTSEEIEEETGLSYDEQLTARKSLVKSGLLEERYKRLEHQMFFRADLTKLDDLWKSPYGCCQTPDIGVANMGTLALPISLNGTTETTTENTTEIALAARHGETTESSGLNIQATLHEPILPVGEGVKEQTKPQPRTDVQKRGDLVDGIIELSQASGVKKSIRIDNLEEIIHKRFNISPTRRGWKDFLEFVDKRQQEQAQMLPEFLDWMTATPKFDISFWGPLRMQENWDRAFVSNHSVKIDSDGGFYV